MKNQKKIIEEMIPEHDLKFNNFNKINNNFFRIQIYHPFTLYQPIIQILKLIQICS